MKGHARNIMTERVTSVEPETPLETIARTLVAGRFGGVPVVDVEDHLLGYVREKDLMTALLHGPGPGACARDIMAPCPTVIDEFDTTEDVMGILRQSEADHLLVARQGRLVGMITPLDVLRWFVDQVLPPPPEVG